MVSFGSFDHLVDSDLTQLRSTKAPLTRFYTSPRGRRSGLRACLASLCLLGAASVSQAQQALPGSPTPAGGKPAISIDTPVGPFDYYAGRGMRFGDTGLTVGGYTIVEIDDERPGEATVELDALTVLVLFEPVDSLRLFAELEIGGLANWIPARDDFDHDPNLDIERLHVDWVRSDALNLRLGKFQTPVGRWNLVPAEPFVWTAIDPVQQDRGFDEHQTGAALFGTLYPGGNPLRWWLYGQLIDPLDADEDAVERSAGGRLEYGDPLGNWSVGGSLLASEQKNEWNYLIGVDGNLHLGPLSLTLEAFFAEGGIPGRDLWSVYLEGVYPLGHVVPFLRDVYTVVRFEHFDPDGSPEDANVWDLGLAWIPKPWLNLKAGYRLSDRITDDVSEGVVASISVLF